MRELEVCEKLGHKWESIPRIGNVEVCVFCGKVRMRCT